MRGFKSTWDLSHDFIRGIAACISYHGLCHLGLSARIAASSPPALAVGFGHMSDVVRPPLGHVSDHRGQPRSMIEVVGLVRPRTLRVSLQGGRVSVMYTGEGLGFRV